MQADERGSCGAGTKAREGPGTAGAFARLHGLAACRMRWQVEAESLAEITETFEIEAVPSFVVLRVCDVSGLWCVLK